MDRTISQASAECLQSFTDCLAVESLGKDEWAENRLADFNLWVSGTGASAQKRASLDSRLALEPQAREVILTLLNHLTEAVNRCKALALSKIINQDVEHTGEQPVAGAQTGRSSPVWSDESTDEELEVELRLLALRSPLGKQMKAIELMLDQLARIALAVRRSGRRSRLQKADQRFKPEDHSDLQTHLVTILLAHPESSGGPFHSFDLNNPSILKEQTDPARLSEIQQRLVRCNLKRRNRFLYAQRHAEKLGSGILQNQSHIQPIEATETPPDASKEPVKVAVTSVPVQQPDRGENAPVNPTVRTGTSASAVSNVLALQQMHKSAPAASTVMSTTVRSLKYPHPPKVGEDVLIFKCPCCCQALPKVFLEGQKWKKHLAHDLSPYTCILPDCFKPETLFATKESWRTHLLNEHHSSEHWICFSCRDGRRFHDENAFREHIIETHATSIPQDDIPLLLDISKRIMPMSIETCPLCNWVEDQGGKVDEDVLLDHIAKDVHSFSLRSLPWADDNGEEADRIMSRSKFKVDSWLINNNLLNESLEGAQEAQAKKADASDYFQHNAYFADSSATSTSSEDESAISIERELEKLKQMDDSLSFGSINEARSEYEANAMDVSDTKPCQSEMVSGEKVAQQWSINTIKCIKQLQCNSRVCSVTFSHDSSLIASGLADEIIQLWRTNTGECIQKLEGHSDWVWSVAFSHDSSLIASGSDDKTIQLWRTNTGECIKELQYNSGVNSVTFSHDSSLIASGSNDGTIRLWRTNTGECIQKLEGHSDWVRSVAFSHDSSLIASGSNDGTIRLWRTNTGECIQKLEGHSDWVRSVAFSHDSSLIASGSNDGTIRLWRTNTGECIQKLEGHSDWVRSVAFSHDSSLIASGSDDKTIRLWDFTTGTCVQTLEGHDGCVLSVAFSHDSLLLASGSNDRTIRLWSADNTT